MDLVSDAEFRAVTASEEPPVSHPRNTGATPRKRVVRIFATYRGR
jgi:hypothetical protein